MELCSIPYYENKTIVPYTSTNHVKMGPTMHTPMSGEGGEKCIFGLDIFVSPFYSHADCSLRDFQDSSFTETLDKQGMSEQDMDCQGKQILYVGDSVGHTANLKFIESSMRCQLESLRAYSSVMDQNARWPSKNFNDVFPDQNYSSRLIVYYLQVLEMK